MALLACIGLAWAEPGHAGPQHKTGSGSTRGVMPGPAESTSIPNAAQSLGTLQDAVASVVVVALTDQFDGKPISVNIGSYDVIATGARERMVSGQGTVNLEGSADAIAFTYRTQYDVVAANAGYPAIAIGKVGSGVERSVPNDSALVSELDERIATTLSQELGGKPVWLQLNSIETFESGQRYVRILADGIVDFGLDGSSPARVDALYDRDQKAWVRVNYALGAQGQTVGALSSGG